MVDFATLERAHHWKPLRDCPGRSVLVDEFAAPATLVGDDVAIHRFVSAATRDPVDVALFAGGGLLSYARADGSYLHTLNTRDGLRRKLAQLGIDVASVGARECSTCSCSGSSGERACSDCRGRGWCYDAT